MVTRIISDGNAFAHQIYAADRGEKDPGPGARPDVCVANIGPRERRQRLMFGLQAMGVGALLAVALIALHVDIWWRLALFLPFSAGASGYFQAKDKT